MNLAGAIVLTGIAVWAADATAGQSVYKRACQSCHGADGAPSAALAKMLKVEMRDLRVAAKSLSDAELRKIVVEGIGKMAATKGISAADADNVVAYMRTLK
jgi:mono/diheme cytochrome c family protein